jgi:hypothetical protein
MRRQKWRPKPRSGILDRRPVAWFEPESHARMLDIMVKPHDIPWQYERWREQAENKERISKRRGFLVVRLVVNPEAFLDWCAVNACEPNGKALEVYLFQRAVGQEGMRRLCGLR